MLSGKLTETLEWWTSMVVWRLLEVFLGGEELGGGEGELRSTVLT